jgi:diaminohydroxyphosphoribosylaminopyrimidine deaminase/5-amino-6-(5-phosphoribosylamino)uracil reductase
MGNKFYLMKSTPRISLDERRFLLDLLKTTESKRSGFQYPNPAVGAMVIKNNRCIGEGYHMMYGQAHAESTALSHAGSAAKGATLLVTLEPCTHTGKTSPCVDAIVRANISRVIWAIDDPNPRTSGKAAAILKKHGIDVVSNVMVSRGKNCIKEFYAFHSKKRPYVVVKAAISLDGMIAPNANKLTYISSPESLAVVHQIRAMVQAILVGAGTIASDQPRLNVRFGFETPSEPLIVILDPHNRVDISWVKRALDGGRTVLIFCSRAGSYHHSRLTWDTGLTHQKSENWKHVWRTLYHRNIQSILVEGGAAVFSSVLSHGCYDELWVTKVPLLLGTSSVSFYPLPDSLWLDVLPMATSICGKDVVIKYRHAFSL